MVVALLALTVLILLFGAGVVRGWLRNALGGFFGILLLAAATWVIDSILGEGAWVWVWMVGGALLLVAVLWARQFDPAETRHRARVKRAKQQRDERRSRSILEEAARSSQSPLDSLMFVFEKYHSRTIPATRAKAAEFYAKGDEKGLRELVASICKRNQDRLEFDGRRYISCGRVEG